MTNQLVSSTSAQAIFTGNFANVQNVNLFAYGAPTVSSENTNVVTVNGVLVGQNRGATIQISEINDVNNWIGRSLFPDP